MKVYKVSINDIGSHGSGFKLVLTNSPEEAKELVELEIERQKEKHSVMYYGLPKTEIQIIVGEPKEFATSPGVFYSDVRYSDR